MKFERGTNQEADPPSRIIFLFVLITTVAFLIITVPAVDAAQYSMTTFPSANTTTLRGEEVTTYTHDASTEGMKIAQVYFTVPTDSQVDFTLYYGTGSTVSGSMENHHLNPLQTSTTVTLGGNSSEYSYFDVNYFYDIDLAGYAREVNNTENAGFIVSSDSYGMMDNDLAAFYPVDNIQRNLIYKIVATGTKPFTLEIIDQEPADLQSGVSQTPLGQITAWVNFALGLGSMLIGIVSGLFAWLKFFFIDNLLMTVSLYLAITMAYAAATSKNIFRFFGKFFNDQRKLFEFILGLWRVLIEIISSFRGIFRI
jgi:hypothetical protein